MSDPSSPNAGGSPSEPAGLSPTGQPPGHAGPHAWEPVWHEEAAARGRRRRVVVALVGVVAIAGLLAGAVITTVSGRDDEDAAGGSRTSGSPSTATGEPASEDEIRQAVEEISAFVAEERGLAFKEDVVVELADDDEFEQRLLDDFEEGVEDLEHVEVFLTAFGLAEPDLDLVEAVRALTGGGVVGFYDPEIDELVVRGTTLSPYVRTTIAHELVHALDDQHFDLDRPEYDDADDEVGYGLSALAEGDARRVENAYRESLSQDEQDDAFFEEMRVGSGIDASGVPLVLFELMQSPYTDGLAFVEALLDDGGQDQLDAAFADPPRTSEQVLDPGAYLAGDSARSVPHPRVPREVVDEGVAGQFFVELVLGGAGETIAAQAAEGWGGDWAVAWRDGDRACVTLVIVGDTETDTAELRAAFDVWADDQPDALVRGGITGPVTVESCVA